ncbi:MAG: THUMP-like domain-containing protein [Planctomycetota bacterium]
MEWFRRRLDADEARWAAEQLQLRQRAARRFPDAETWRWTAKGLEQATRPELAERRARRIAEHLEPGAPLLDLTCGLGSDSRALADAGLRPLSFELDPETALAARHNLGGRGGLLLRANATRRPLGAELPWMCDPDRRAEGPRGAGRSLDPEAWSPAWSDLLELWRGAPDAVLKLAPATDWQALDARLPADLPRTWRAVGFGREALEVALWTGAFADAAPRAAEFLQRSGADWCELVDDGGERELKALDDAEAEAVPAIAEPHPTALRAGLLGVLARRHGLAPLGPGLAFLAGPPPVADPFLTRWKVLGHAPLGAKQVRRLLREWDVGPVSVKARGVGRSSQDLEQELRGPGSRRGQLLVARLAQRRRAFLVEPLD